VIIRKEHFQQRICKKTGAFTLVMAFCAILSLSSCAAALQEPGPTPQAADNIGDSGTAAFQRAPVYRIPLRVHVGESERSAGEFRKLIGEINDIWLSQAGICFEMQIVQHDEVLEQGMDIWFMPVLPGGPGLNGYFRDEHDIHVRDTPILRPAEHPARHPAPRTAAHELGHGLSLQHRQDSDNNLMRSKTFGWQLNKEEVLQARSVAADMALQDTTLRSCSEPVIVPSTGP
jgi:hypothetical protein